MNISKLMTFINRTIFWDFPKQNREQTNWMEGVYIYI